MGAFFAGLGTAVAVFVIAALAAEGLPLAATEDLGVRFCMYALCIACGLIVGFGWKILDEIKALKARLPKREDAK
ncbi:MAG TPA: hypothetical protein H9739_02005 [Candidatus Agathobaculum pullistercoris]|nr:hypothetical protein [uncultured Agathobaculum sp.]HIX10339.1 hypothetical protein [Candidatus Agathobaculum pullistercoris]